MAVALSVLDATVVVLGPGGERRVPVEDLHRLPGDRPEQDTNLGHGELVVAVEVPWLPAGGRSTYYKARDRASFAFALASVAAVLRLEDDVVADVRLAWGGVAHKPWRARRAEEALTGRPLEEAAVGAAVHDELAAAAAGDDNAFKLDLVRNVTWLVLRELAGRGSP
jgi:xanthine dehydrogenase YagS FAD-binding subunit